MRGRPSSAPSNSASRTPGSTTRRCSAPTYSSRWRSPQRTRGRSCSAPGSRSRRPGSRRSAPKARALTGEIADGWMTFVTGLPTALHEVEEMAAACRAAGRAPASLYKTGFTLGCVLREGEDAASPRARAQAGPLVPVMFHAFLERTVDPERLGPELGAAVTAFR